MLDAVRTVSETDDVRIIEGRLAYGGPFAGRDFYGTVFSSATDYGLDLHPGGLPVLFDHGFDPEIGLHPIGRTEPPSAFRRMDDGLWLQMQIDKRNDYYEHRVKPLLEASQLGLSQGSAEHSVDIDARTGQVRAWPLHEVSLTPTEANPASIVAARTAAVLRVVAGLRGWLPEGTSEGDLDDGDFAWLATDKKLPDSQRRKLPYKVHGRVNEAGWKAAWSRAHQDGTQFDGGPDQAAVIKKLLADAPPGVSTKYDDGSTPLPGGRSVRSAAADAGSGAGILASLLYLMDCEADEPDQLAMLRKASDALSEWITAEQTEIGTSADDATEPMAFYAVRAGARNSAADQSRIDAIHDHTVALGATAHATPDSADAGFDTAVNPADDGADAARNAEGRPGRLRIVAARPVTHDVDPAVRSELLDLATTEARRLLGR